MSSIPIRLGFPVLLLISCLAGTTPRSAAVEKIPLLPGECWWGGRSVDGPLMPYDVTTKITRKLYADTGGNQARPLHPNDQTTHNAQLGLNYPFNEYRATWKMAGRPLVQRLRDKTHIWEDLRTLIPGDHGTGPDGLRLYLPRPDRGR